MALSFLTISAPFFATDIPPLTDYPNHLARFWLLGGGALDPVIGRFYAVDWSNAVTNIGVDRVIALLSPPISALALGRLAAVAAAFLPPLGVLALSVALHRRVSAWQAMFPLAAWSTTYLMGFLNFEIGLGLALIFVAPDPLVQPRLGGGWRVMRIPFGLILAGDHLFALIFYAILLAGLGLGPEPLEWSDLASVRRRLAQAATESAWCLIPLAAVVVTHAGRLPGAEPAPATLKPITVLDAIWYKIATLGSPLASYNTVQAIVTALALAGVFIWLVLRRVLRGHTGLMFAFAAMVALEILLPSRAAGASWVDRRFSIMAVLCLLAAVRIGDGAARRVELPLGVIALCLCSLQSAWIAWNWRALDADLKAVDRVLANVPPGAAILPLQHAPDLAARFHAPAGRYMFGIGDPVFRHFDSLAVPTRHAFVPNLFAARGLQPIRVLGDWDRVVEHNGGDLAPVDALTRAPQPGEPSYIRGWRERFSYVLVLNADMPDKSGPFHPPAELSLVSDQGFAQLWRVAQGEKHGH